MGTPGPASDETINSVRKRTARYFQLRGRRPRILLACYPHNGSERAVKSTAAAFADMGFDVDIGAAIQSPAVLARIAAENDVHAIGILGMTSMSKHFIVGLLKSLKTEYGGNIMVAAWMADQSKDLDISFGAGEGDLKIFGPQTGCEDSASQILDELERPISGRCADL